MPSEDHDILIEIRNDLKNHLNNYSEHLVDDKANFKLVFNRIDFHSKVIYGALGIVGAIELISKFIK